MEDKNQRIVKNTILMYTRSFVCMLLSLYSSRLFLQALGAEDYGIYNAVGGFVSMFWMISNVLTSAIGRFINISLGENDKTEVNKTFSLSLIIMAVLAIVAVILAESGGVWFMTNKMTIPSERMGAATLAFHLSVLTLLSGFLFIPYNALIIAYERLSVIAYLNIGEAVAKLILSLYLVSDLATVDHLKIYAIVLTSITLLCNVIGILYASHSIDVCRHLVLRFKGAKTKLQQMLSFSLWNFIGGITGTFYSQGVNMALNVYCGPVVNAARGLSNTVANVVNLLVYNFQLSITPQITQSYGAKDFNRTRSLVFGGTKSLFFLMLIMTIPLFLEIPFVLKLWLKDYPAYTDIFARYLLLAFQVSTLDTFFITAIMAGGRIRNFQLLSSIIVFSNFPIAILLLKAGLSPVSIYFVALITTTIKVFVSVYFSLPVLGIRLANYITYIFIPLFFSCIASIIPSLLLYYLLPEGWPRFLSICICGTICTIASAWFIGFTKEERKMVLIFIGERFKSVFKFR